jgi:hypothetical protein
MSIYFITNNKKVIQMTNDGATLNPNTGTEEWKRLVAASKTFFLFAGVALLFAFGLTFIPQAGLSMQFVTALSAVWMVGGGGPYLSTEITKRPVLAF